MQGFFRRLERAVRKISAYNVTVYAANASFFILLSIFPAVMLFIGILQYTPLTAANLNEVLAGIMPAALSPLLDYMTEELFAVNSVALVSVSAVIALWSASRGVYSLVKGLNSAYHVRETRNYFAMRLRCAFYTVLLLAALLLTLVLHLFGQRLLALAENLCWPIIGFLTNVLRMKYLLSVLLLSILFTLIFLVFPNRQMKLANVIPGAFLAAVAWILFSSLFSYYVTRFGNFSLYYGSMSVIVLTMLWLYCCMSILFYCGIFNNYLQTQRQNKESQ